MCIKLHLYFLRYRLAAIELLMCLAQVHDGADVNDLEIRCNVADIFMFFLPGIASGLRTIALEDEKSGHKTTVVCNYSIFPFAITYSGDKFVLYNNEKYFCHTIILVL